MVEIGSALVALLLLPEPEPEEPGAPCGMVKSNMAEEDVPRLVTAAAEPGAAVVMVPIWMVAAWPEAPGWPVGPEGPVWPWEPAEPVWPWEPWGPGKP